MSKYLLKGTGVKVFPFGQDRSNNDPYSRVLNEQNITNIIKSITDNSDYVVDYDDSTRKLQFVLNGYYFAVDISDLLTELPKDGVSNIYAYINMIGNTYKYLGGGDIISSTLTGEGTSVDDPYVLEEGSYTVNLSINQNKAYFEYTFTERGSIVFNTLTNISVNTNSTLSNNTINGSKNNKVIFELLLNDKADSGTASFNVLYPGSSFSAVKFTDNINNIDRTEKTHQLHVLTAEYSKDLPVPRFVCVVPKASFNKFTASSLDVVNINCGTASDYSRANS